MPQSHVNVDQWTDLFRFIGLTDPDMKNWHEEFERRHPDGHQGFLEWLQLSEARVAEIRAKSAAGKL